MIEASDLPFEQKAQLMEQLADAKEDIIKRGLTVLKDIR